MATAPVSQVTNMAPLSVCGGCRERHLKCKTNEGEQSCQQCTKTQRRCDRRGGIHFKTVSSVPERNGEAGRIKFVYSKKQVWVPTSTFVDFVADPAGRENDGDSLVSPSPELATSPSPVPETPQFEDEISLPRGISDARLAPYHPSLPGLEQIAVSGLYDLSTHSDRANHEHSPQQQRFSPGSHNDNLFPQELSPGLNQVFASLGNYSSIPKTPESQHSSSRRSTLSKDEAVLLRNYIDNIAPWTDAGDPLKHFGVIVPQRTIKSPMLRLAIFALSAQQLSLVSKHHNLTFSHSHYYTECISLLIPALSDSYIAFDDNLMAAVVLLRSYEEISSEEDKRCHLLGTQHLLDSTANFSSSGGLGEAASWVSLRQLIYISLTSREPILINLDRYEDSHSSLRQDDYAWANVIVLLFARVLALSFESEIVPNARWTELETRIEEWACERPDSFLPLSGECEGLQDGDEDLPEIWMLGPSHVVGVQYYYLAKLFVQARKPVLTSLGFDGLRANRERENSIRTYLRIIIRIAIGNPKVENGWFTASHILSACGCYLQHPKERSIALAFLENVQTVMGWKGSMVAARLKEEWRVLNQECS